MTLYGPMLDGALRYALSETIDPPVEAKHARPYKLLLPLNLAGCGAVCDGRPHPHRALQCEAEPRDRVMVLDVLAVNEPAQALYRPLGPREVTRHGQGDVKVRMFSRTRPASSASMPGLDG